MARPITAADRRAWTAQLWQAFEGCALALRQIEALQRNGWRAATKTTQPKD